MLVCVSFCAYCTRDRGCSAHPVFPAPSSFGAKAVCKTRANDAARTWTRVCSSLRGANGAGECPPEDRRRAEAIQSSSVVPGLLRFARNDGGQRCLTGESENRWRVRSNPNAMEALFRLDAGRLDDRPPAGGLGLLVLAERFRRLLVECGYLNAEIVKMLARFWIGQPPDHGGVQFRNNVLRRALGRP